MANPNQPQYSQDQYPMNNQDPNSYDPNMGMGPPPMQGPPPMDQQGYDPNMGGMQPMGPPQQYGGMDDRSRIEEVAEAIIDEKWEELLRNLNKISEWKEKTEAKLNKFEQELAEVRASFDKLHKAIIGKIGEYDQNILNVGTEIKAMERVFQKILPTFTENVNELSRITKNARNAFSENEELAKKQFPKDKAKSQKKKP